MDHYVGAGPAAGQAEVVLGSSGRDWLGLDAEFLRIPRGRHHVPGGPSHRLGMHFGMPVNADCRCDGRRSRRIQKHGDIDFIPAELDGSWEDDAPCTILRLSLAPALLQTVAGDLHGHAATPALRPLFQLRDPRIEAIALAIKAELEADIPSDPLYGQSLAIALATRLLALPAQSETTAGKRLSVRQYRLLADFIELNLEGPLSLAELAALAGLGLSQFKLMFPRSFGMTVHQYVLRRRVERAKFLIEKGQMPLSEIALATGFAHQSHMATWMRRLTGMTPGTIAGQRPILRRAGSI